MVAWAGVALSGATALASIAAGFIPARFSVGGEGIVTTALGLAGVPFVPAFLTPLSAALVHGGLVHLAFNMLMLGFCGRFVEVALGARGMLGLYVAGAYASAFAQYLVDPRGFVPMVGASGAISALFGAYALLFGERRGRLAEHRFGKALHILWLAAAWTGFQLLFGFATSQNGVTIAIAAHIGGFFSGLTLARPILRWRHRRAAI